MPLVGKVTLISDFASALAGSGKLGTFLTGGCQVTKLSNESAWNGGKTGTVCEEGKAAFAG